MKDMSIIAKGIYSTSYSRSVMTLYESYKEEAANGAVTP
jgi:hypothetical protein